MGKVLLRYNSLDSTNLEAQKLISQANKPIEGTTILAELQTDGRGQRGNTWESPTGQNLLCSFILYPKHLLPKQQFILNIITSLSLLDLIEYYHINDVTIKWPNDIYVDDKKIAGILIQNNVSNQNIVSTIIGIGLNVNQTIFDSSLPNPSSLAVKANRQFDKGTIFENLAFFLEKRYLQSKTTNGVQELRKAYTNRLFRLDIVSTYLIDGKHLAGIIKGIDPIGGLILQMEEHTRVFDFQELKFVI